MTGNSFPRLGRASPIPGAGPATNFRVSRNEKHNPKNEKQNNENLKPEPEHLKLQDQKLKALCYGVFFLVGTGLLVGIAISIGVLAPATSSFRTGSLIFSAFFTRAAACQICASVSRSLNAGIPDSRMPFSTFQ